MRKKKEKKSKPTKDKIVDLLKPFSSITQKNSMQAYRSLIDKYPEIIEYLPFMEIALSANKIEELAERILTNKTRRNRFDAEAGYTKKRKNLKYAGRQRGKLWAALKKIDDIRVFNKDEWELLGINDEKTWRNLFYKTSEARIEGIEYESLGKYTGYSYKALNKMIDEQIMLEEVFELFKTEVDNATRRNNKRFLKIVKMVWEEDADVILNNSFKKETKKGRKISYEDIKRKSNKIRKIIASGGFKEFKGDKEDYLALRTRLCIVAQYAYYRLLFPLISKRREFEMKTKRLEVIKEILDKMKEYSISPLELLCPEDLQTLRDKIHKYQASKGIAG